MKSIFTLILSSAVVLSNAQVTRFFTTPDTLAALATKYKVRQDSVLFAAASLKTPQPLGTIYSASTFANTTGFTAVGSASASVSSNKLVITGGSSGFGSSLDYNYYTALENFRFSVKATTTTAASICFGINSVNGHNSRQGVVAGLNPATGDLFIFSIDGYPSYSNVNLIADSSAAIPVASGNEYELVLEMKGNVIVLSGRNITQGGGFVNCSYAYGTTDPYYMPNTGRFSLFNIAGTQTFSSISISSAENKYGNLLIIGDSKAKMFSANSYSERYASILSRYYSGVTVNAGASDRTAEVLLRMPEILSLKARNVLIAIGTNDKHGSVSYATWAANFDSIYNRNVANGSTVYVLKMMNETSYSYSDYNTHIAAIVPANRIVDAGTVVNADGVHPNDSSQLQIANAIHSTIGVIPTWFTGYDYLVGSPVLGTNGTDYYIPITFPNINSGTPFFIPAFTIKP